MQLARYRTSISRDKLKNCRYDPDASEWEKIQQVRETPEQYFQPAVAFLNAVLGKSSKEKI